MAKLEIPTPETLRQLLRYDPETGKLFWLPRTPDMFSCSCKSKSWNKRWAGKEAGSFGCHSSPMYRTMCLLGRTEYAHRIAWAMHHDKWPSKRIDHINGDTTDNRIENLQDCSASTNGKNQRMRSNNTSGVNGVCWDAKNKRWLASIRSEGSQINLGRYATIEEATAARVAANTTFGFSSRHGTSPVDESLSPSRQKLNNG